MAIKKSVIREILFGQRGITKMSHLWFPLLLLILKRPSSDLKEVSVTSLYLFIAVLCKVMFSIQINDICDRKEDDAAGKKRWISYLPQDIGIVFSALLMAAGLAAVILAGGSVQVVLFYMAAVLLGLFYSLRPLRFKERGLWGIFIYALAATVIYVLVPWAWLGSSRMLLALVVFTVMSDKWVQINFHQIVDYSVDLKNGTRTYAVRVGLERTRSILRWASRVAVSSMLSTWGYMTFFVIQERIMQIVILVTSTATIAASGIFISIQNKDRQPSSELVKELPGIYLGLTYLVFCVLPPVGFIFLALKEPLVWTLTILSALSFFGISFHSFRYRYR